MRFFGHSGQKPDKSDWQKLDEHLVAVARLSRERGARIGLARAAFLAGLLHDVGKYTTAFQKRLEGGPAVDHSTAGAHLIWSGAARPDRALAELAAYAVLGHHAGLPDRIGGPGSFDSRIEAYVDALDPAWRSELAPFFDGFALDALVKPAGGNAAFAVATLGRLLFSCLVDADFVDTERHYSCLEGAQVDRVWPGLPDILPALTRRFDAHMAAMPEHGELNATRRDILAHARARAAEPRGPFTLTVPTGGGKTLASLGFALDHARAHGLRRIIYAIPYTSIIDQTVDVFRKVLGEAVVLAHHSGIEQDSPRGEGERSLRDKARLAMEDWAAPIVVTTNVQLFESLFAARPSRARKLHNIVDSVVILDEAQTLPRRLLAPAVRMIDALTTTFRASVVLCTATQPAFDKRVLKDGLALEGRELAPDPKGLARRLARATIRDVGPLDDAALTAALAHERQALCIVNSRRHALALFRAAREQGVEDLLHLSTRQCAAHRRALLATIRERLNAGAPCRVVATSLVEAGVDLDFPKVWRARAGLDQIVQAAGRCNREGERGRAESLVAVFDAPDHPPPAEIGGLVADMRRMRAHDDLLSLDAIENYFEEVYWRMGERLDAERILSCFEMSILKGTNFGYRTAAQRFRMIESGMEPVIVPYDAAARRVIEELGVKAILSGALARGLQPYLVQVPPQARRLLLDAGHVAFAEPELRADQFAVLRWEGLYDAEVGLVWENGEFLSSEMSLIS